MAKRYTDSEKWDDPWFTDLTNEQKLVWFYLLDNCDNAGLWKKNIKLLNFHLGTTFVENEILEFLDGRILPVGNKWFIEKFIIFQYGTDYLTNTNKAVLSALEKLELNKIITFTGNFIEVYNKYKPTEPKKIKEYTLSIPYQYPIDTPKDKDKEEDKDKDRDKDKDKEKDKVKEEDKDKVKEEDKEKEKEELKAKLLDIFKDEIIFKFIDKGDMDAIEKLDKHNFNIYHHLIYKYKKIK